MSGHALYALAWVSFGLAHSLLARQDIQDRLYPLFGAWYRLAYNVFALTHFAGVIAVGHWAIGHSGTLGLPGWAQLLLWMLHGAGWIILLSAGRGYDLGRFSGLTQIRLARAGQAPQEQEPLHLDGFHRWIRHPLYAGAYLILWGAAQTPLGVATALWGSIYLVIGTYFEERKLLRIYGAAYADYKRQVPAVVPWRGRAI